MSFEGYYQGICKNGHYHTFGVEYTWDEPLKFRCDVKDGDVVCGEGLIWWNLVDDTNCEEDGKVEVEILTKAVYEKCDKCGFTHLVKEATYKVPEGVGYKLINGEFVNQVPNKDVVIDSGDSGNR
jgi:hypothetical protein